MARKPNAAIGGSPMPLDRGKVFGTEGNISEASGTSIFDPVLCELIYRWFCPPRGQVLDPFAGGSVRGLVASRLGRYYVGLDLRPEQIAANKAQRHIADQKYVPEWRLGDALEIEHRCSDIPADLIFTCPPYGDLEVYSDDIRDLSRMDAEAFVTAYRMIIVGASRRLKMDRFAVFVVGAYRDAKGFYIDLPGITVRAFEDAGMRLYNEAILVTAAGSLPVRARKQFVSTRKLGKTHQNILAFIKGDPRRATEAIGDVQFGEAELFSDEPAVLSI